MTLLVALTACSSSFMTLTLAEVSPVADSRPQIALGPYGALLTHRETLQLLLSGRAENPKAGKAVLPLTLTDQLVELGAPVSSVPLPASHPAAELVLAPDDSIVTESRLPVVIQQPLSVATQRRLRAQCAKGWVDLHYTAKWSTPGLDDPDLGWSVKSGSGSVPRLMDPQRAVLTCDAPADDALPAIALLQGTSPTQARVLGRFQGHAYQPNGPVPAGTFRAIGVEPIDESWTLSGAARTECEDTLVQATGTANAPLLVGGTHPVQPRPVTRLETLPDPWSMAGLDLDLTEAWSVDLDGDGTLEVVTVALSDTYEGAPDTLDHSLVSVHTAKTKDHTGFPASHPPGKKLNLDGKTPRYTTLDGIADITGDGRMELVISHHLPWSHYHERVVYQWSPAGLWVLATDLRGERDCYASSDWTP